MDPLIRPAGSFVGRGAGQAPPNRFERVHAEPDLEHLEYDEELAAERRTLPTTLLPNDTRRIICENDSPDVGFRYSINPYRGCEHGCAYCYARPGHETLGFNAGLDFETKILVKHDAPRLLREELGHPAWRAETISISGVTDCYQPAERKLCLTRGCLEVLLEARQPCGIITKNVVLLRDLDLLVPMAERRLVHVFLSVTTLDESLARTLEPRTATPSAKLRAIRRLADLGIPVGVMVAPIIPGLTDSEVPAILAAAQTAGAQTAGYVLLRLPWSVRPIFSDWLARNYPLKAEHVETLIRSTHGGKMYVGQFGSRMRGGGPYAEQIAQTFRVFAHKHGLDRGLEPQDAGQFRPPTPASGQLRLF
jgi:DNA repair photolyase